MFNKFIYVNTLGFQVIITSLVHLLVKTVILWILTIEEEKKTKRTVSYENSTYKENSELRHNLCVCRYEYLIYV